MKMSLDKRLVKFYLWLGLGYSCLALLSIVGTYSDRFLPLVFNNIWAIVYIIVLNFILFEHTVPFILRKKRTIIYNVMLGILLLWVHAMLYSYGFYAWRLLGIQVRIFTPLKVYKSLSSLLQNQMAYSMGSVFFFGIVRHVYQYIRLKQSAQLLRIEKKEAELNYLKAQTNPHFLFNTLNNIYSLARDKSDLAAESILKLSKILRYMLYETGGAYIAIEQEMKILDDYIALEKLRYDETLRINFNHNIEDMKQAIPPLILIPLVENAFKHGVSETRGNPFVEIHLSVNNRQLYFVVKNSTEASGETMIKENIGLSNLRRQLELLYKEYDLSVQHGTGDFTATLKINLASHV